MVLQDLQVIVLMLCRMGFCLSHHMVVLHLDNSSAIYIINMVQYPFFLSRLAFHILNLASKHGITFIPAYIPPISTWKLTNYCG